MPTHLCLFAGAGIGAHALRSRGYRCIGYVEWDTWCQRQLARRIASGHLDAAPIWGDVRAFARDGWARRYRGVDLLSAGFPCQPFSQAGNRRGADDARDMWPATLECIRDARPRELLLENVPGLATVAGGSYFARDIIGALACLGYDASWGVLPASAVGAPHRRKRLWIAARLADADHEPRAPV